MNFFGLARRSVFRKPVKSILLLLIVFAISTLLLAGVASKNASIEVQDKTRQAIGAGVGLNYYKRRVRYIVVQNLKNVLLELMLLFFQKIQWDIVMTDTKKECKWH